MALERYIYDTDEWFWVDTHRPCDDGRFPEIDVGKVLNELIARVEELEAALSASSSCCGCSVPFDEEDEDCGECRVAKMRVKALGGPTEIDPFRGGE